MFKRRFMFYIVVLAVLFSAYVGYRFYENRVKPTPAAKAIRFEANETDHAFLQRAEPVSPLSREVAKRSPSLNPPVWTYTPEKWDSGAVDSVQVIALVTDVVGFHAIKLPDGKTYRLPLPKEEILLERDVIGDEEANSIRIFTTPENRPESPVPSLEKFLIPYSLIAGTGDVKFHAIKLPDGKSYWLPLPREKMFLELDRISDRKRTHIIISPTPKNPLNIRFDVPTSDELPAPYSLIANVVIEPGDTSLTQLRDWMKSVGGAARAQALLEAAGLSDSVRITTSTRFEFH